MHRILVADDEPEIVKLLEEFLTKMGFEAVTALGGERAIEILKSEVKIDLMVLDMKMPQVKGTDVLREMKKINKEIPIIILTGSIDVKKYIDGLKELGYNENDICYKPVDLYVLLNMAKKKLGLETK